MHKKKKVILPKTWTGKPFASPSSSCISVLHASALALLFFFYSRGSIALRVSSSNLALFDLSPEKGTNALKSRSEIYRKYFPLVSIKNSDQIKQSGDKQANQKEQTICTGDERTFGPKIYRVVSCPLHFSFHCPLSPFGLFIFRSFPFLHSSFGLYFLLLHHEQDVRSHR